MARRTKKVGITGKYGVRYGASLRKMVAKLETMSHARYSCPFCGNTSVKKSAVGIWKCKSCKKVIAGGAWQMQTATASSAAATITRLRKIKEDNSNQFR